MVSKPKIKFIGKGKLYKAFDEFRPYFEEVESNADFVIYSKFYVNVDGCEKNPVEAHKVSIIDMKELLDNEEAHIIYISSNYVFGKDDQKYYIANSKKCPVNLYGFLKAEAEDYIKTKQKSSIYRVCDLWDKGDWNYEKGAIDFQVQPTTRSYVAGVIIYDILFNKLDRIKHVYETKLPISKYEFIKRNDNPSVLPCELIELNLKAKRKEAILL